MKLSCLVTLAVLGAASAQIVNGQLNTDGVAAARVLQGNSGNNGNGNNGNGNNGNGSGNGGSANAESESAGDGGCDQGPSCELGNGEEGVIMCRLRNAKKGMVMQSCVSGADKQQRILDKGGACGCCDFEDPVGDDDLAKTGECPSGTCEDPCELDGGDGVYMCRPKGASGKSFTQCVNTTRVSFFQGKGAMCGCCDGECPTVPCSLSGVPVSCTNDDVVDGYYMCRSLNPKKLRFKTECVEDDLTLDKQFKGAKCGCCGIEDGALTVNEGNCPAVCSSPDLDCEKVDEDAGTTESGSLMCMGRGNKKKTMCVVGDEEILNKQAQGLATCGCCGPDGCPGDTCDDKFNCAVEEGGDIGTGSFMCLNRGNSGKTMIKCVEKSNVLKIGLQGRGECGCCDGPEDDTNCPSPDTPDGTLV